MTTEDQKILHSLSDTMMKTRAELDALRILFTGLFSAAAAAPEIEQRLIAALQEAINVDIAVSLASQMSDEMLQQRVEWFRRLTPSHVLQRLELA